MALILLENVAATIAELDRQHRIAIHRMRNAGAPINFIPPLTISFTVVPANGVNAVRREQISEAAETITEDVQPLIESVTTRLAESKQEALAKTSDQTTGEDTNRDNTTDTNTETQTDQSTEQQNDTNSQSTQRGTTDRVTTYVEV